MVPGSLHPAERMNEIAQQISIIPEHDVRIRYATTLEDWAETDTAVRKMAAPVLGKAFVDGDSVSVPSIEEIVEHLVAKLASYEV